MVVAYCDAWVARSGAELLWRLQQEVLLQRDEQYWSGLDPRCVGEVMAASVSQGRPSLCDAASTLPCEPSNGCVTGPPLHGLGARPPATPRDRGRSDALESLDVLDGTPHPAVAEWFIATT